ncbi:MAG: hypothetical protein GY826_40425, partial [Fuerstiella sp.]|nr:hypothetical protein [Fuerstiella sp.]
KLVDTAADDEVADIVQQYRRWFRAFRSNTAASLIVHGLEMPAFPACGILDAQREFSQTAVLADVNRGSQAAARSQSGIYFLDYDNVVSNYGRLRWYDERRWLTARLPICADGLPHLADAWVRHVLATSNRIHKVLVTDLDNTLWGGVVGEDSLSGIKLGSEYPGAAFLELQRVMLDLHQRGILLAVRHDGENITRKNKAGH